MSAEEREKTLGSETVQAAAERKLTLRLTDRPVRINEVNWPILTEVRMPIFRVDPRIKDGSLMSAIIATLEAPVEYDLDPETGESLERSERFVWMVCTLHVCLRKHADGRVLLYGVREGLEGQASSLADELGGELLVSEGKIADSLKKHAKLFIDACGGCRADAPEKLIQACLARLTPECLDADKQRKPDSGVVVLNGGCPVLISPSEWTLLSDARILMPVEMGHERLAVRQHGDGRSIVYGYAQLDESSGFAAFNIFSERGGEIVSVGSDLLGAIKRVGATLRFSSETIRACINGLPAQDLE